MPDAILQRRVPLDRAAVPKHMVLEDDSGFERLDEELTLMILQQLPLREKLSALTAVCKGWRSLRNVPSCPLFTDLNLVLDLDKYHVSPIFVEEVLAEYGVSVEGKDIHGWAACYYQVKHIDGLKGPRFNP